MTQTARRIYYSLALVVFFVSAPLVLLPALGYQWAGWRVGWRQTGVLVLTVNPRAQIAINGRIVGSSTTKYYQRLLPGPYDILVSRTGYDSWHQLVRVDAHNATVVGPLTLFPDPLTVESRSPAYDQILYDHESGTVAGVTKLATTWHVKKIWPASSPWSVDTTFTPSSLAVSPKQRIVVIGGAAEAAVFTGTDTKSPWIINGGQQIFWGSGGDTVFFGFLGTNLYQYDAVAKEQTLIGPVNSATWANGEFWTTVSADQRTSLRHQKSLTDQPTLFLEFSGVWQISPLNNQVLYIRNTENHQAQIYTAASLRGQTLPLAFTSIDRIWWANHDLPMLWLDGPNLLTLDAKNQPQLLERGPEDFTSVDWIDPRQILATIDGNRLAIRSVGSHQGHTLILQQPIFGDSQIINVDRSKKTITVIEGASKDIAVFSWK